MPQLDPTFFASQLFWLAVSFAVLYFIFARRVLPGVAEVLENRQNKIADDLERAELLRQEAEDAQQSYEAALLEARQQAGDTIKDMHDKVAKMQDERKHKLDESLAKQMNEAEIRIKEVREKALNDMEEVAVGVTQHIVEKLMHKPLDEKTVRASLEQFTH